MPADVYLDGLAVTIPKWQGCALAAKVKLLEMKAEPQSPDGSGNLEISPEIYLETQIKCINPYLVNYQAKTVTPVNLMTSSGKIVYHNPDGQCNAVLEVKLTVSSK